MSERRFVEVEYGSMDKVGWVRLGTREYTLDELLAAHAKPADPPVLQPCLLFPDGVRVPKEGEYIAEGHFFPPDYVYVGPKWGTTVARVMRRAQFPLSIKDMHKIGQAIGAYDRAEDGSNLWDKFMAIVRELETK